MNFLVEKSFSSSSLMPSKSSMSRLDQIINTPSRTADLLLGVCSAAIAFPLITLVIMFSIFFPEHKWEEFWDKFLES